jgi:hypothetical protein
MIHSAETHSVALKDEEISYMKSQGKYLELGNKRYCEFEIYMTMTAMIYTLLVTGYLMSWVME